VLLSNRLERESLPRHPELEFLLGNDNPGIRHGRSAGLNQPADMISVSVGDHDRVHLFGPHPAFVQQPSRTRTGPSTGESESRIHENCTVGDPYQNGIEVPVQVLPIAVRLHSPDRLFELVSFYGGKDLRQWIEIPAYACYTENIDYCFTDIEPVYHGPYHSDCRRGCQIARMNVGLTTSRLWLYRNHKQRVSP
jgi:hypothetical protein